MLAAPFSRYLRPGEAGSDTNPLLNVGLGGGLLSSQLDEVSQIVVFSHRYYLQSKNLRSNLLFLLHVSLHPNVSNALWPMSSLQMEPKFSF